MLPNRLFLLLIAVIFSVTGCSHYRPAPAAFHAALQEPYRLDSGDTIRLLVYEEADLSQSYAVDQAGYVSIPLVGNVPARGRTAQELELDIAARLADGFLRDPDVAVEVERYRPIFVMGEVGAAGQYLYVPGMTVQKAIAASGGFSPRAYQGSVDITRSVNGEIMTGRVPISDPLLPGDTLYVRERLF
ncbi:polysaccharide biosynthesis/export family protein [Notoacmeibacter ruber]|uniref:Polysaccharide export protein n=1 Tax=Notoacmeibacter ruber TaxID=2670375 RepID=A0A3L7JAE5_9HYPH|nr:polysaccharide biosynthesis/export family protein [Notoacmeibacter ruber]RLQ87325.1 polysaccharide export protein [Notoacmeibacter ruber]